MKALKLLSRIGQGILMPRHPSYLVFFVTSRCNCSCSMCFNRKNVEATEKPPELSLSSINRVARSLYPLPQLLLSGGEPFIREDISELVRLFYHHAGSRQVSIPTNGALTYTTLNAVETILKQCPEVYLNINLSIDGLGEDHDTYRGLQGCFDSLCETYKGLSQLRERFNNLSINVNTIIKRDNAGKEMKIIDYIKSEFDVNYHFVSLIRGDVEFEETEFDMDSIDKRLDELYADEGGINRIPVFNRMAPAMSRLLRNTLKSARTSSKRNFCCRAGRKIVVLTAEGDLYPCEPLWLEPDVRRSPDILKYRLANLADYDFDVSKALRSSQAISVNRYIDEKKCTCRYGCAVLNGIMYCPAMYPKYMKELIKG